MIRLCEYFEPRSVMFSTSYVRNFYVG